MNDESIDNQLIIKFIIHHSKKKGLRKAALFLPICLKKQFYSIQFLINAYNIAQKSPHQTHKKCFLTLAGDGCCNA
jgi:hypothetical protein